MLNSDTKINWKIIFIALIGFDIFLVNSTPFRTLILKKNESVGYRTSNISTSINLSLLVTYNQYIIHSFYRSETLVTSSYCSKQEILYFIVCKVVPLKEFKITIYTKGPNNGDT